MVEKARIILAEDVPEFRETARRELEEAGHEVVIEADSREFIENNLDLIKSSALNVGVIDGNLRPGSSNFADGRVISAWLRETFPEIKIIAFTSGNKIEGSYGDLYVNKKWSNHAWPQELVQAVEQL